MNIRKDEAGYVTDDYIKASGFIVTKTHTGQGYELYDYQKDGKLFLTGGYWTYYLRDRGGNLLFEGWWNSNEEFDTTIEEAEKSLNNKTSKKTALQEILDTLEKDWLSPQPYIDLIRGKLEKEKDQLCEMYVQGRMDAHLDYYPEKHAKETYNQFFG